MSNTDDSIIKLKKIQDLEVFSGELPAIETAGDVLEAKSYADLAREAAEQALDIVDKLSNDIAYESEENTFTQVNTFDNDVVVNGDITMSGKSLQERLDGIEVSVEEGFESLPTLYAPLSHAYNNDIHFAADQKQTVLDAVQNSVEHIDNLSIHVTESQKTTWDETSTQSASHIGNSNIHVTEDQKQNWDSSYSQITEHVQDNVIHVTQSDRNRWDLAETGLLNHVNNTEIHITQEERTKWNAIVPTQNTAYLDEDNIFTGENTFDNSTTFNGDVSFSPSYSVIVPKATSDGEAVNLGLVNELIASSGGGSGDVTAAGDNTFTGVNYFNNTVYANKDLIFLYDGSTNYGCFKLTTSNYTQVGNTPDWEVCYSFLLRSYWQQSSSGDCFPRFSMETYYLANYTNLEIDEGKGFYLLKGYNQGWFTDSTLNTEYITIGNTLREDSHINIVGLISIKGSINFSNATVTGLPGGGDVTSSGNNIFTGENTFENDATVFQRGVYIHIPEDPYSNIRMHVTQEPDTAGYTFISQFIDTRLDDPNVPQFRMYWSTGSSSGGFKWMLAGQEVISVEYSEGWAYKPVIILDAEHTIINGYTAIRGTVDFTGTTVIGLSGGGSGDVTAAGDNTFTGLNTFVYSVVCRQDIKTDLLHPYSSSNKITISANDSSSTAEIAIDGNTKFTGNVDFSGATVTGLSSGGGSINIVYSLIEGSTDAISSGGVYSALYGEENTESVAIGIQIPNGDFPRSRTTTVGYNAIGSNHGVAIGYEAGILLNPNNPTLSWGSVAIGTNTEVDLASYSVVIGCGSKAYGIPGSVILGLSSCAPSTTIPDAADQLGSILIGVVHDKSEKPNIIIGDTVTSSGNEYVIGIGKGLQLENATNSVTIGNSIMHSDVNSVGVGYDSWGLGWGSITIGASSSTTGSYSAAIGFEAQASSNMATSIGSFSKALVQESVAIGPAVAGDKGVTVIGSFHGSLNARYTLVYIISNGSELAEQYTEGYSAIGFVVYNTETSEIIESGIIPLKSLCTLHRLNFSPAGLDKLKRNFDY